jgi:glucose/mannose transport system substrate-binding protein
MHTDPRRRGVVVVILVLAVGMSWARVSGAAPSGRLEIFSWWTAGGEAQALKALFDVYHKRYPTVEIVNAAIAGGAGSDAKTALNARMIRNNPPDSFQVHAGQELIDTWVQTFYMAPLTDLFKSEKWTTAIPGGLLDILSTEQGKSFSAGATNTHWYSYKVDIWSVPADVHRANMLWYNKKVFADAHLAPPTTFDEFFTVADALKAKGIVPFVVGDKEGWEAGHVFETVLIGTLGPDEYAGLWNGQNPWTTPKIAAALDTFKKMLSYMNTDHAALTWDRAASYIASGKGAMMIIGDWASGWFQSRNFTNYGWVPAPGNAHVYDTLSDTFGLPKRAKNQENAMAWLRLLGSREGQEAFNPIKGSICARTDCNPTLFSPYQQWAMAQRKIDRIVPSVVHGAAASAGWVTEYENAIARFVSTRDTEGTQQLLRKACVNAQMCK